MKGKKNTARASLPKGTVRKVLRYVGKYPLSLAATLLLAAVTVGFTLYVPILVGDGIDCIVDAGKGGFFLPLGHFRQNRRLHGDHCRRAVADERLQQPHRL